MITNAEILDAVSSHSVVTPNDIKALPKLHVRIGTKFLYPDGSGIDLFVGMGHLSRSEGYVITDFGRTFAKLAEYQMNVRQPPTRPQTITEMARPFKVDVQDDRLMIVLNSPSELGDGLIRLGQACISVASLIYTRRSSRQTTLSEEVKSVIENTRLPYETKFSHTGPYHKPIFVDYRVGGPSRMSSLLTIGPHHSQAAEAFSKWSDLRFANTTDKLLTIFDDRSGYERTDDLSRLERVSEVISIKNPLMIESSLKAA